MREARDIMGDLVASGLTGEQSALLMELSAAVAAEARPIKDEASERRRERDRERQREIRRYRQTSADSADVGFPDKESPQTPKKITLPVGVISPPAREAVEILSEIVNAIVASHLKRWKSKPPPPGVTDEQWTGFIDHRRHHPKGGTFTLHAYKLFCTKLAGLAEDGWPPGQLVDLAIERGWITVFEPKDFQSERTNGVGRHQSRDGLSATSRAAARVFGTASAGESRTLPQ